MIKATKTSFVAALAGSALACSMPAFGQDMAGGDGGDDTETATLLAYLGLTAASGENTVGEGAGGIEGHMLAAAMAMKAAKLVVTQSAASGPVVLLNGTETLSLGDAYQARRQLAYLEDETLRFLRQVAQTRCRLPDSPLTPQAFTGEFESLKSFTESAEPKKFTFQPSDGLGLARTSSSFTPVSVTLGAQLFKNAILAFPPQTIVVDQKDPSKNIEGTWIIPSELSQPTGGNGLIDKFNSLRKTLVPYADGECDKVDEAIKKSAKTLLDRVDGLVASKEGAPSLLDRAAQAESILSAGKDLKVLRVDVDRAGGTLVNTSNVFTTLGFPGVTIRGGMVVTYRLTNPTNGQTLSSGIINCRVPKKLLKTITSKAIDLNAVTCEQIGS